MGSFTRQASHGEVGDCRFQPSVFCATRYWSHVRSHILVECSYAAEIWSALIHHPSLNPPSTYEAIVLWVGNASRVSKINAICKIVLQAVIYEVWRERNSMLHSLDRPTLVNNQFKHPPLGFARVRFLPAVTPFLLLPAVPSVTPWLSRQLHILFGVLFPLSWSIYLSVFFFPFDYKALFKLSTWFDHLMINGLGLLPFSKLYKVMGYIWKQVTNDSMMSNTNMSYKSNGHCINYYNIIQWTLPSILLISFYQFNIDKNILTIIKFKM